MGMTERIGFIGLGNMGSPMSACIARAGLPLTVFDVDPARTRAHAEKIGAKPAVTLAELGEASDIVVTMLPTGKIVRDVMLEMQGGLASSLKPGTLIIDMSSSVPTGTRELGEILSAKGIILLDSPVSGAVPRATDGTLTLMVGADDKAALERARPVLSVMGNRIFETGGLGSGHAMKALNNYVAAAGFAAASEALIMADKFGLDRGVALDIMNVSTGRNFSTESTIKSQVLTGAFASGFGLALITKDVKIAADLAQAIGVDLPLVAETSAWWTKACDTLGGENDHTAAYKVWSGAGRN
jgi:3-hydroxyisobutyrate dehydrogenase